MVSQRCTHLRPSVRASLPGSQETHDERSSDETWFSQILQSSASSCFVVSFVSSARDLPAAHIEHAAARDAAAYLPAGQVVHSGELDSWLNFPATHGRHRLPMVRLMKVPGSQARVGKGLGMGVGDAVGTTDGSDVGCEVGCTTGSPANVYQWMRATWECER